MAEETRREPSAEIIGTPPVYLQNRLLSAMAALSVLSAVTFLFMLLWIEDRSGIDEQGLTGWYISSVSMDSSGTFLSAAGGSNIGFIAYSRDSGATWIQDELPVPCRMVDKLDIDWKSGRGIAIADSLKIYLTSDTGRTWRMAGMPATIEPASSQTENLVCINWASGEGYYCITSAPKVLRTTNYGATWNEFIKVSEDSLFRVNETIEGMAFDWSSGHGMLTLTTPYDLSGEDISDPYRIFNRQILVETLDSGKTWTRYHTNLQAASSLGEISEYGDLVGITRDGFIGVFIGIRRNVGNFAEVYNTVSTDSSTDLLALVVDVNQQRGIAVGVDQLSSNHGILSEFDFSDAIGSYNKILLDSSAALTAAYINESSGEALAASADGRIWKSSVPGKWQALLPDRKVYHSSENRLQFALLFSLLGLGGIVSLLFLRRIFRRPKPNKEETVESVLGINPDNPTDNDRLGFAPFSKALVDLIRNPGIHPPVSIVVNGDWGSGKTSLMLQVKKQLEQPAGEKKFITSWFNIWHFDNEEQTFNAFITSLAVSLEKRAGLRFRLRVFYSKLMKLKWSERFTFGFGFGIILLVGVFALWISLGSGLQWIVERTGSHIVIPRPDVDLSWLEISKKDWLEKVLMGGGILGSLVYGIFNFSGQYTASGISAIRELIPIEKLKIKTNSGAQGVREQFRREFREIMKAAKKEKISLVVFIDDLDRASGDRIKDILATMNFISDAASNSGNSDDDKFRSDIFFIMGMASDIVVNNMNRSMFGEDASKIIRGQSAENYLEKMVDVVIRVPKPRADLLAQLASEKQQENE